jgi:hypothetical protein
MSLDKKLLDSRDLPEIFREIYAQQLTGVLFAERLKYRRSIYFQAGAPIFATSNLSEDKIGKILFTQGKINMDQLMQALDKAKQEKKRLGSVLVELEFISAKELFEAVVFQVEQVLFSLFDADWKEARYSFDTDASFGEEVIKLSIQPVDVLAEGIRRSYGSDLIAMNVGEGSGVFKLQGDGRFDPERLKISPEERRAVTSLDGKATIDQIVRSTGAVKARFLSILLSLKMMGFLKSPAAKPAPARPAAPVVDIDTLEADEPEEVLEEASLDLSDIDLPEEILEEAEQVPAKPVAPPRPAPPVAKPAAPPPKTVVPAAAPPPPRVAPAAAAPAPAAPAAPPARAAVSVEDLKAQAAKMRQANYYQRLGLANDAQASGVVAAYSALRRKYESELPQTLRPAGKIVLQLVVDAYKALALEGNRRVYDSLLNGGGTPQEVEQKYRSRMASTRFDEGKRAWDAQDFAEAEKAFRESIELEPSRADYYFGLGLALAAQDAGAPGYAEVEALFTKAATLQSDSPRGYYYLGTLFRQRGEVDKAVDAYRRALSLDSRYSPAREGLTACGQPA